MDSIPAVLQAMLDDENCPVEVIKDYLTEEGMDVARVYVVVGSCGEYSDYRTWQVCAFLDKDRAEDYCVRLNDWCKENGLYPMYSFERWCKENGRTNEAYHRRAFNAAVAESDKRREHWEESGVDGIYGSPPELDPNFQYSVSTGTDYGVIEIPLR